jgi:crossover junction endodeoxyribonuclease RuvC
MHILGLDPGTATTGFGVIRYNNGEYEFLDYGCIKTSAHLDLSLRLQQISGDLKVLLRRWKPQEVAVEKLFFSKNVKTAIHVAHARGAILNQLTHSSFRIAEYTPQQVKEAVTGYGKAEKLQVQKMVQLILHLDHLPYPDDAADALAIAICHANSLKISQLSLAA